MKYLQLFFGIFVAAFGCTISSQNKNILTELRTIDLPKVEGRIDHMSIDIKSDKLFIAALGNGSIEIVDLKSGRVVNKISGSEEPQGVLYYDRGNSLFVTSAGDGTCKIFSVSDLKLIKTIKLGGDADNIRYDKKRNIVFVGFGSGDIAAIDPVEMELIYEIELPAHPESFQIDESRSLMFVNVPDARQLDVIAFK